MSEQTHCPEADRLEQAAQTALNEGDYNHYQELHARAQAARRRARERAAGVSNPYDAFLVR